MLNCLLRPPELQTNAQNNHQQGHIFKIKFYNNYTVIQRQELFFVDGVLHLKQQSQEIIILIPYNHPYSALKKYERAKCQSVWIKITFVEAVMEMQVTISSICFPSGQIRGFPQHCNIFYV